MCLYMIVEHQLLAWFLRIHSSPDNLFRMDGWNWKNDMDRSFGGVWGQVPFPGAWEPGIGLYWAKEKRKHQYNLSGLSIKSKFCWIWKHKSLYFGENSFLLFFTPFFSGQQTRISVGLWPDSFSPGMSWTIFMTQHAWWAWIQDCGMSTCKQDNST